MSVELFSKLNQLYAEVFNALFITNWNQLRQFDRLSDLSVCLSVYSHKHKGTRKSLHDECPYHRRCHNFSLFNDHL